MPNDVDQRRRLTINEVLSAVSQYYCVSVTDLMSARRHRSVVRPRHVAMYIAQRVVTPSLIEIGCTFGGRDQVTVLLAIASISAAAEGDPRRRSEIDDLMRQLTSGPVAPPPLHYD